MSVQVLSIHRESSDLSKALQEGVVRREDRLLSVIPREVVFGSQGVETVVFEVLTQAFSNRPHLLKVYLKALRLETLTLSLSPFLVTLSQEAFRNSLQTATLQWVLAFFATFFLQIAANGLNDVEDHLNLLDRPGSVGGSGVIQKGWMSAQLLRRFARVSLLLGAL